MPIADKRDDKIIRRVKEEAKKFNATVNKIDLERQILDIDCPEENRSECAVAIQKIFDELTK
jgi:hypothetical protein